MTPQTPPMDDPASHEATQDSWDEIAQGIAVEYMGRLSPGNLLAPLIASALRQAAAKGREQMRERAAVVADVYADENIHMAQDTILLDPVLRGHVSVPAIAQSETLQIEGCIHSSMFHAAQNIAGAIRALPLTEDEPTS